MTTYYIGVDLGTTAVKAALFDETGALCGTASREVPLLYPRQGEIEQSPECWYEIPCALMCEVCTGIDPAAVRAIGISSQGISVVPTDGDFRPLRDGVSWLDARAEAELSDMLAAMPEEAWFARTGKHASALYTLPKLLWLKRHEPDAFRDAAHFLMPLEYLTARLCGCAVTDPTMAGGTMLYDLAEEGWSAELCRAFGVPEEKLARIAPSCTPAGYLNAESQRLTGLGAGTLVAVGAQDQKISAYGAEIEEGTVTLSLGTAGAAEVLCSRPSAVLPTFVFRVPGCVSYTLEACVNTFGAAIRWARDNVFCGLTYAEMDRLAETAPAGSGGVRFYPHLSGVSTPHFGTSPVAGWSNLTLAADRGCLIRALYEGLACEVRANLDAMREAGAAVETLRVFGGGSRSRILCRILCDIAGIPLEVMDFSEIAAFGAAKAAFAASRGGEADGFVMPSGRTRYTPCGDGGVYDAYRAGQRYAE
jgi:xylulokinase